MHEEYLVMADVFDKDDPEIAYKLLSGLICKEEAAYAASAIEVHDDLVSENERLANEVDELKKENERISAILLERTQALGPY